jgi:hypothetical protein
MFKHLIFWAKVDHRHDDCDDGEKDDKEEEAQDAPAKQQGCNGFRKAFSIVCGGARS